MKSGVFKTTEYFNGMSTRSGLVYAEKLGNCVHFTFIPTFLCNCFVMIFLNTVQSNTNNFWTDLSTTIPSQSGPGSNGNEGVIYIS